MRTHVSVFVSLSVAALLTACSSSRPAAHLIINNESDKEVPLSLSITQTNKKSGKTISNNIKPGLQEFAAGRFSKGLYSVSAEADNGVVSLKKNVSLDTDRWIMITYTHGDSLKIQNKYGYIDTSIMKKIDGKYTGIDIFSESRRPANL